MAATANLGLADRLKAELLTPGEMVDEPPRSTTDRILDAAAHRFADVGIDATTMSSIAAEADLSREWLYRHFPNRDAIVVAVVQRTLRRFIDGLASRAVQHADVVEALTETFVYCVEFLRDQSILEGMVDREVRLASADFRAHAGAVVAVAVRAVADYLVDLGGFDRSRATVIAETLTRLVGSTVIAPSADLDLHDGAVLRDYATRVVPAVVGVP